MAAGGGNKAVVMALIGNGFLTVIKTVAFLLSGSSAMLAEAIHSLADTGNQTLLLIGVRTSSKKRTHKHPWGYGKDRYVWALLSAAGIFFLGCGVTITHGVHALISHGAQENPGWVVWTVLAIAFLVDGAVLVGAVRQLNEGRDGKPWLQYLKTTPDTATVAVLFEDGAAALGVILAVVGIGATHYLGIWWADGAATIAIGILLGVIAAYLGRQNRLYLIDRAVSADVQAKIIGIIRARGNVKGVFDIKSRIVGAGELSFTADINFDGKIISDRIQGRKNLEEQFTALKSAEDLDELLDEHARVVVDEIGEEIDRIEAEIRRQIPNISFIQLEVD